MTPVRPDNYLAFAIVSAILFFPPTGIVAIVKAAQVDSLYDRDFLLNEARKQAIVDTHIEGIIKYIEPN